MYKNTLQGKHSIEMDNIRQYRYFSKVLFLNENEISKKALNTQCSGIQICYRVSR